MIGFYELRFALEDGKKGWKVDESLGMLRRGKEWRKKLNRLRVFEMDG